MSKELAPIKTEVINVPTEIIALALPELKVKYIVIIYQDDFGNWYASIKPKDKTSIKISVEFYVSRLFRRILDTIADIEFTTKESLFK